jgi:hypothetical protein
MPVSEITAAVVRAGFKSKNKTLGTTVGIALAGMPGVRRVRRGVASIAHQPKTESLARPIKQFVLDLSMRPHYLANTHLIPGEDFTCEKSSSAR